MRLNGRFVLLCRARGVGAPPGHLVVAVRDVWVEYIAHRGTDRGTRVGYHAWLSGEPRVSKTGGCRFESCRPCWASPVLERRDDLGRCLLGQVGTGFWYWSAP